ncbi:hypothetical protein B0H13DRAFT_2340591 [Mycena leptocephala]|nr:hypothetical protein B0H13DRAFT_2340591 [Mycena leptocephala]
MPPVLLSHGSLVSHSLLNGARSTQSIPVLPSHSHLIDHFTPFPIHLDAILFSKAVHRRAAHPAASSRVDLATPTLPVLWHRAVLKEPTFPIDSTESKERDELKEGLGKVCYSRSFLPFPFLPPCPLPSLSSLLFLLAAQSRAKPCILVS